MSITTKTIAAPAAYAGAGSPDVTLTFEPKEITFINEDATAANAVFFSFDGVNDAGKVLGGNTTTSVYVCLQRQKKIWFKRAAGTPNCTIIAES